MKKSSKNIKDKLRWETYSLFLISLGVLGVFSIYTNAVGVVGIILKNNLCGLLGKAAVSIPFLVIIYGMYCLYYKKKPELTLRLIGVFVILILTIWFLHISVHKKLLNLSFLDRLRRSATLGVRGQGGGIFSETALTLLFGIFGSIGTYILMVTLLIIGFIFLTGISISEVIKRLQNKYKQRTVNIISTTEQENCKVNNDNVKKNKQVKAKTPVVVSPLVDNKNENKDKHEHDNEPIISNSEDDTYVLPQISMLNKGDNQHDSFDEKEILKKVQVLEDTLASFSVDAKVSQVSCGPTITRFEINPSPGTKVSKIVNLSNDIALNLAASDVRIEAPIPGKAAIGIEVPNKKKLKVVLRDVLSSKEFKASSSKLSVALGKDIGGRPVIADLGEMPHLLIAGATGSGKSVCINTIIASILFKAYPNEVKLMLVDPKVVELGIYNDIPHLLTPVVTDAKKAALALNWMVAEMERRYKLFAEEGVRDITRYNEIHKEDFLPKIVIIIDELADLMMVSPQEVEDSICRLAQMARAAGIHLVVATQRPSVDIITGLIKANIPSRISFAVSSQVDSRTILDISGAEKLLGKGDMLFYPVEAVKPIRIQGAYISDSEVEKLVSFIKEQKEPFYEKELSDFKNSKFNKKAAETDELFDEALAIIVDNGQASISFLQRKLHIGYTRAARLIDQLEDHGFIGGYEGTKPREILITKEQYNDYISK